MGGRYLRMGMLGALTLAAVIGLHSRTASAASSCITCHLEFDDPAIREPAVKFEEDVHNLRRLGCESCHGGNPAAGAEEGDPELAHDPKMGFRGAPSPGEIPEFCGGCHSNVEFIKQYNPKQRVDQLLEYKSSHHGKLLASGEQRVATCVSCHGVHGILPVKDTRSPVYKTNVAKTCAGCHGDTKLMASFGIPTNQFDLYKSSVHGHKLLEEGDLAAPTCNTCHGNHGATPPGLTSVSNACGECHANNLAYFNESPHKEAFAEMGIGECETCHGHHDVMHPDDDRIGVHEEAFCVRCHSEGDAGYAAAAVMGAGLDSLKRALSAAHEILDRAERGGVNVALGKFDLHSADDAVIKARTGVHYFDTTKFNAIIQTGLAETQNVMALGEEAMHDLWLRRVGLMFTVPVILWVAIALYLRIRRTEREQASNS